MKLVKTVTLEFREGKSDKVYEVDLAEVGPDRFVVNFRYGRRGSRLQSGSKTAIPVDRAKAEAIYAGLVSEKVGKGYHEPGAAPAAAPGAPAAPGGAPTNRADATEAAILARLAGQGRFRTKWALSRVAWRAGELRLRAAEPLLWPLLRGERPSGRLEPPPPTPSRPLPTWSPWGLPANEADASRPEYNRWAPRPAGDDRRLLGYIAAWALGRCGSAESLSRLRAFVDDRNAPAMSRRIALESIRLLMTPEERARAARQVFDNLPPDVAEAVRQGQHEEVLRRVNEAVEEAAETALAQALEALPTLVERRYTPQGAVAQFVARVNGNAALRAALRGQVNLPDGGGYRLLADLYWIDDERTRPALLALLRTIRPGPNAFLIVRYLFKVAELRDDFEVLGLLNHRFETTRSGGAVAYETFPFYIDPARARFPLVRSAYSANTRNYLRRRVWRILADLGRVGSPDYVRLAEQVLLPFEDGDAGPVVPGRERKYGSGRTGNATIDRFGRLYAFNRILYWNSPRYRATRGGLFVCKPNYQPGDPAPETREEAYRELWNRAPEVLLRLLERSPCTPVHEFAARALRANPDFCRGLGLDAVKMLASSPYLPTARLGMELAVERFDPDRPDGELVLILAGSVVPEARRQAERWLEEHWGILRRDVGLVADLAAGPGAEMRAFVRGLLRRTSLPDADAEPLVGRVLAVLLAMGEADGARAADVAETLLVAFRPILRRLGEPVVRDLLAHPLAAVQLLAGDIILGHDRLAASPPPELLRGLFASAHAEVRAIGVRLLDQLGDDLLKADVEVLAGLLRHELADLRENVRATVRRLAAADPAFGRRLAVTLAESLLVPGGPEGVPSHLARVLRDDLGTYLDEVPSETVLRLLASRSRPAQEVGGLLLPTNVDAATLGVAQLVELAGNDILAVRDAAWAIARLDPGRIAADLRTAYRLADAKWEDSRRFAFELFRGPLGEADWPPEALVGLCDSVRPDVQRFGQEMIGRHFRREHGERYALELTEHPDPAMQAFAGQFLDQFSAEDAAQVRRLQFFCTAVLSRVNRGRVAKARAFAFLERAARAGQESAGAAAEVLGRISATSAIADRARAVALLTEIHAAYPALELPIRVRPAEVRLGV